VQFSRRKAWWLGALASWAAAILLSDLLFGERAPILLLCSAAVVALSVHATAIWVRQPLGETVKAIIAVPLGYLREFAPLLLPLIVALVFMSRGLSPTLQLMLGPTLVALAWVIVAADVLAAYNVARTLPQVVKWTVDTHGGRKVVRNSLLIAFAAILIIGLFNYSINQLHVYGVAKDLEGGTAVAIVVALGFWLAAFVLAALGTATTWTRFVVALLLIAVVLRFGAAGGVLPWWSLWRHLGGDTLWLLIGIALPVAAGIAEAIIAQRKNRTVNAIAQPPLAAVARYAAFLAALIAALILTIASSWGLVETNRIQIDRPTTADGQPITPANPETPPSLFADHNQHAAQLIQLAEQFSPVLDLSRTEKYGPSSVPDFLATNKLSLILTTSIKAPVCLGVESRIV